MTAVVILNFNGEALLRKYLPSVVRHSGGAKVVVVDNGSTDNSLSILEHEFPQVHVIPLDRNYGFCGGYNRALQQVNADYYVLLNSDVEVTERWLQPMEHLLAADPTIAAVQPKILSFNHRAKFEYAGAGGGFIDALGYPFCRGRIFDHVEDDAGQYNDQREVFWTSGACMMVRAEAWHRLGGLDEDFFAHMEEIDLCWKAQRAGMRVWYCGTSVVYHLGAGTLGYDSPGKIYLNFRNGLALLIKHLGTAELIYKIPARVVLDWLAAMVFLVKGNGAGCASVFRAHGHVLKGISRLMEKRRLMRNTYPDYPVKNVHPGLIVFAYYLQKKKRSPVQ